MLRTQKGEIVGGAIIGLRLYLASRSESLRRSMKFLPKLDLAAKKHLATLARVNKFFFSKIFQKTWKRRQSYTSVDLNLVSTYLTYENFPF